MAQVSLRGIQIQFPYEPYEVQEEYMSKVIECLQTGVNGILESPTGTGKTLSLLCSSLAWLESRKAQQQLAVLQHSSEGLLSDMVSNLKSQIDGAAGIWNAGTNFMIPKIIYSSRTHSQLSQVAQELKRSNYKHVRSVVLGSRDQLCLHPEVMKVQNHSTKVYMCRSKISNRACPFYLNVEEKIAQVEYQETTVMDIEDLTSLGKKHTCCPYYASRNIKNKSDIMFMPYNYIIDPKTRRSQGIELEGNVVIFDEGHNIEGACEESMSFQLRSLDLALCINEVTQTIEMIKEVDNKDFSSSDNNAPDFTLTDLSILKVMFCELEEHIDKAVSECGADGSSKPGDYMIDILSKVELTSQRKDVVLDLLDKIILYHSTAAISLWASKGAGLQKFSDMIKILFSKASGIYQSFDLKKEFSLKYRVYLQYEKPNKSQNVTDPWSVGPSNSKKKQSWKLDCWCFSPGIGMQDVMNHEVHSIILTSGTLSPLAPLISELGISFPVQLENPHIISNEQFFVSVVSQGPDATPLNSSYQNRFSEKYVNSLGRTISNFCRIIPDGVLVFFPSYSVMKSNINQWEETGVWQSLSGIKPVFSEPQGKDAFQESIDQFYSKIHDPESKGAVLLAVCRGKVSEGLDFADKNARGVIITGLPFPPSMDPRVKMKMAYLDALAKGTKGLCGADWYVLQASRAVNQAIGRVIRHRNDYGAILLCDNRFAGKRIYTQLSKWIQGRIQMFNSFGPALKQLSGFFKVLEQNPRRYNSGAAEGNMLGGFKVSDSIPKINIALKPNGSPKTSNESVDDQSVFQSYLKASSGSKSENLNSSRNSASIFEAMDKCSTSENSRGAVFKSSTAVSAQDAKESTSRSDLEAGAQEPKRRKINIQLKTADESDLSHKENKKNADREMWKQFLADVKTLLGPSKLYNSFCTSIKEFRTQKDATKFAHEMKTVFSSIHNKEEYLKTASLLVSPQERTKFLIICALIGSETS